MRLVSLILFIGGSFAHGSEIDSFSLRDESLHDATFELNTLMNGYIKKSIDEANTWGQCDNNRFRKDLHNRIGGVFWSRLEDEVGQNKKIDKRTITRSNSIYKDVSFLQAPGLYLASLGHIMRLGKYFIGDDKLGHFIEEGYNYYKIIHDKGKKLADALAFGEKAEKGYFGSDISGVYSPGDLAANYQGYKEFWLPLIGSDEKALVKCNRGKYSTLRPFNWGAHVNAAWDEGINCNSYKNEAVNQAIAGRIKELEKKRGMSLSCPIIPKECPTMIQYFGEIAPHVITKKCFSKV